MTKARKSDPKKGRKADVFEALGFVAVVAAGFLVCVPLGLAVLGIGLLVEAYVGAA